MSEQGYGSLSIKPQVESNQLESKGKENNLESQESDSKNKTEAPKQVPKMRQFSNETNEPHKVDLSKKDESKETNENDDKERKESNLQKQDDGQKEESNKEEQGQEVLTESEDTDSPLSLIEEIEETKESEESNKEKAEASESTSTAEASDLNEQDNSENEKPELNIPEGAEKLFKFMEETGGGVEDYVRLNMDVDSLDEQTLLKEYYKSANPHLDSEDIDFKIEELSYDEELDDDREVRRKKLQYKEELSKAKQHLNGMKNKYYEELKLGSKLSPEQREAVEFYNSHKQELEIAKANQQDFATKTNNLFNEDFKGFKVKVGDKDFMYKVADVKSVKESQSDFVNVFGKYFDEKTNQLKDPEGYHKALYFSQNAEDLANSFYEQGKADALKESEKEAKNISMDGKKDHSSGVKVGGQTFKVLKSDTDSTKLKVKIRQ